MHTCINGGNLAGNYQKEPEARQKDIYTYIHTCANTYTYVCIYVDGGNQG